MRHRGGIPERWMAQAVVGARGTPGGEHEIKYAIPGHMGPALRQWLGMVFPVDRKHPESTICTVYLDTPSLESLEEKEASFYEKTKYRIRWYLSARGEPLSETAFLEIKEKTGAVRRKRRVKLPLDTRELSTTPLEDPQWRRWLLGQGLIPAGMAASLRPVLELRYERRRHRHPLTGDSICLDSAVRCVRTHSAHLPAAHGLPLDLHIFEQKGPSSDPLPALRALPRFLGRRASLSKYYLVAGQLTDFPPAP